jgi:hypothetical protein
MSIAKDYPCINQQDENNPLLEKENGYFVGKSPENVEIILIKNAGHTNIPLAQVIRKKCLDCCGFQPSEVRKCTHTLCPNWPYRMGKNPFQSAKCKSRG